MLSPNAASEGMSYQDTDVVVAVSDMSNNYKYLGAYVFKDEESAYDFARATGEIAGYYNVDDPDTLEINVSTVASLKGDASLPDSIWNSVIKDSKVQDYRK